MRSRRRVAALACAALLAGSFRAGVSDAAPTSTLTIGSFSEFASLNPMYVSGTNRGMLENLMFPALLGYDAHGELAPRLASVVPTRRNGGVSADGRTIVYHLRRDAHWSDGVRVTAADVVFTHDAQMSANNAAPETLGDREIERIVADGEETVRITLRRSYGPFLTRWHRPVLPMHLLAKLDSLRMAAFNAQPVGCGPFRFVDWERGDHLTLEADPSYWDGPAKIARIVIKFSTNSDTLVTELRTGELDVVIGLDPARQRLLADDQRLRIVPYASHSSFALFLNVTSPLLSDSRVRQAIAFGFDRVGIVRKATSNEVDVDHPGLALFGWAYAANVGTVAFDPVRARALLDAAGWHPGATGVREKDGRSLTVTLVAQNSYPSITSIATQMAQDLAAIGIGAEIKTYVDPQLFLLTPAGTLYGGHFEAAIVHFGTDTDPDISFLLGCEGTKPNPYNFSHLCDSQTQFTLDAGASSFDRAQRQRSYLRLQRRIAATVPFVLLASDVNLAVVPKALDHFDPSGGSPYWNVAAWSLR